VVGRLPGGADKVLAARASLQLAERWHVETMSAEAENGMVMAAKTLAKLEAEDTLHKRGLAERDYLDLVHKGAFEELLIMLYEHPGIIVQSREAGGCFPDINSAVEDIAEANDINVCTIKYGLLDRWLPESKSGQFGSMDETMSNFRLDFKAAAKTSQISEICEDDDEANFIRCVYLCQVGVSGDREEYFNYLLKIGFSTETLYPTTHKLRALRCLLSVANDAALRQKTSKSAEDVRSHLSSLHFVSRLQSLNLPYDDAASFAAADKTALVESVLRSCGHLKQGILLAVDICVADCIFQPSSLWSGLLNRMVAMFMERELRSVLDELNRRPHLWHFDAFRKAWNFVLLRPFEAAASLPVGRAEVCDNCVFGPKQMFN
jgi:hypothetical protein